MTRIHLTLTCLIGLGLASAAAAEVILRPVESLVDVRRERPEESLKPPASESLRAGLRGLRSETFAKRDDIADLLFVPAYFVDPLNGDTTEFTFWGTSNEVVPIAIQYFGYDIGDGAIRTDTINLAPGQVVSVNVAGVPDLLPQGDGTFGGFVRIANTGKTTQALAGDFMNLNLPERYGRGERMAAVNDLCEVAEVRFQQANRGESTFMTLLVDTPQGANPDTDPPTVIISVFDSAGNAADIIEVYTGDNVVFLDTKDLTTVPAGILRHDFNLTNGYALAEYVNSGFASVAMNAICRPHL